MELQVAAKQQLLQQLQAENAALNSKLATLTAAVGTHEAMLAQMAALNLSIGPPEAAAAAVANGTGAAAAAAAAAAVDVRSSAGVSSSAAQASSSSCTGSSSSCTGSSSSCTGSSSSSSSTGSLVAAGLATQHMQQTQKQQVFKQYVQVCNHSTHR
jgi:hypothetical protein